MSCIMCAARKDEIRELEQRLAVLRGLVEECDSLTRSRADVDLRAAELSGPAFPKAGAR